MLSDSERLVYAATFGAVMATCGPSPDEFGEKAATAIFRAWQAVSALRMAGASTEMGNHDVAVMAREFAGMLTTKGDAS